MENTKDNEQEILNLAQMSLGEGRRLDTGEYWSVAETSGPEALLFEEVLYGRPDHLTTSICGLIYKPSPQAYINPHHKHI